MANKSNIAESDFREESRNLKGTLENVEAELLGTASIVKDIENTYTKGLRSVDPDGGNTKETILKGLKEYLENKNYDSMAIRLKELEFQSKDPYFARIKFVPKDNSNNIFDLYIGRHSFLKNDPYPKIVDWRSPIAALYYSHVGSIPHTSYTFTNYDELNKTYKQNKIEGALTLRRRIDIENKRISKIYDASENLDLLTEILEAKTGGVLETIIESIQAEQDEIIRSELDVPIIVQGVAGSGKTTIALHKISYLIYNYSDLLNEKNILFLLNSPILTKYVKSTLSDLGISDPKIFSLRKAVVEKLQRFKNKYELDYYDVEYSKNVIDSDKLISDIEKFCNKYKDQIEQKLNDIFKYQKSEFYNEIDQDKIFEKIRRLSNEIDNQIDELIEIEDGKSEPNYENPKILRLKKYIEKLKEFEPNFELQAVFKGFLSQFEYEISSNESNYIYALYIFAHEFFGDEIPGGKYNYTLVDEGQEYTDLEYEVISRLTHKGRISILGDVNQNTSILGVTNDWDKVIRIIEKNSVNSVKFFNLKTSFRNTKQITGLNRTILAGYMNTKYLPESYNRNGSDPKFIEFNGKDNLMLKLESDLKNMLKDDFKSACIIELDEVSISKTQEYLAKNGIKTTLIDKSLKEFETEKVYIGTEENIRGLEFSNLFILNQNKITGDFKERRLYLLYSRTINNLNIYSIDKSKKTFV